MTLVTLSDVLQPALNNNYAVAGLVTLGWEDSEAYVQAAENENLPVILQAGPSCRSNTPLPIIGKMFRHLAEQSSVPVVAHLDHGYTIDECKEALDSGFTSLMYDGSRKPLEQNIDETAEVAQLAHESGISCEGEIGFVGYEDGEKSTGTDPFQAATFIDKTGVDALAISVGNIHLQQNKKNSLNLDKIRKIEQKTNIPLVIHGGSGIPEEERRFLARNTNICKINIGTELRILFGNTLRNILDKDSKIFDRISILNKTRSPLIIATSNLLKMLR